MKIKKVISNIWPYILLALLILGLIYMTVK